MSSDRRIIPLRDYENKIEFLVNTLLKNLNTQELIQLNNTLVKKLNEGANNGN